MTTNLDNLARDTIIHPTSLVEKGAKLGVGVQIGPFCRVSADAVIGDQTKLISHVVFEGLVTVGSNNVFHPFAVMGGEPQDLSYKNEKTIVQIGDKNIFREGTTVHRGTANGKAITTIHHNNYLMAYSHVAHDCVVGSHNIMANQVALAGHVEVEDYVMLGGLSAITQKSRIGSYAFLAGCSVMRRDLPPFMSAKNFSDVAGPNLVGLKRRGFSKEDTRVISELYKIFYLRKLTLEKALAEITTQYGSNPHAQHFLNFIAQTKSGVQR